MAEQESEGSIRWTDYYKAVAGRAPRPLLVQALERWAGEGAPPAERRAVDLGCGDGTETRLLLDQGWRVLAVDSEPEAMELVRTKVPPEHRARLDSQVASFEQVIWPATDLVYAGLSLFFCPPAQFPAVWAGIGAALRPGGRFAGHLLGERDTWAADPGCSPFTEEQVRHLLRGFDIEFFHELDHDGTAVSGPKHWHVFEVIARKKDG